MTTNSPINVFGMTGKLRLARYGQLVPRIAALEPELERQTDADLRKRSLSLRYRAKAGEKLASLAPEAGAGVWGAGGTATSAVRPGSVITAWHFGHLTLNGLSGTLLSSIWIRAEHCEHCACTLVSPYLSIKSSISDSSLERDKGL